MCLGVWLDRRTDTKESPPVAAGPALVSETDLLKKFKLSLEVERAR